MREEAALHASLDRHLAAGERGLDAALLAVLEIRGEIRLAHLARKLGVERALVLRAAHGLAARGRLRLRGKTGLALRVAPAAGGAA